MDQVHSKVDATIQSEKERWHRGVFSFPQERTGVPITCKGWVREDRLWGIDERPRVGVVLTHLPTGRATTGPFDSFDQALLWLLVAESAADWSGLVLNCVLSRKQVAAVRQADAVVMGEIDAINLSAQSWSA